MQCCHNMATIRVLIILCLHVRYVTSLQDLCPIMCMHLHTIFTECYFIKMHIFDEVYVLHIILQNIYLLTSMKWVKEYVLTLEFL